MVVVTACALLEVLEALRVELPSMLLLGTLEEALLLGVEEVV